MTSQSPFDPPQYDNERGKRRLIHNLRWALKSYEIAADAKTFTSREHLLAMRKMVEVEADAMRKHYPDFEMDADLAAMLGQVDEVLGECSDLNPLGGEGIAPSPFPLPAVSHAPAQNPETAAAARSATVLRDAGNVNNVRVCRSEQVVGNSMDQMLGEENNIPVLGEAGPSGAGGDVLQIHDDTEPENERTRDELSAKLFDAEQRVLEVEGELAMERRRHEREVSDIMDRYEREKQELIEENDCREQRFRKIIDDLSLARASVAGTQNPVSCVAQTVRSAHAPTTINTHPIMHSSTASFFMPFPNTAPGTVRSSLPISTSATVPAINSLPSQSSFTPAFFAPQAQVHSLVTPSLHPTPPSSAMVHAPANDQAAMSLLAIQTESHAYQMLVQRRPKHKFSGENKRIDFESYLHQCEALMKIPGATDAMKLAELPFWFSGTAGLVIDRFIGETDAPTALASAFRALKKEFGRKRLTAKQMLSEQLQGEKFAERDYAQVKTFVLNLEKIYKIASETGRQESFNLPECINEIIRTKVPHLAPKWAKKVADMEINNYDDDDVIPAISFPEFVSFLKKQNTISQTMGEILKAPETAKTLPRTPFRVAASQVETSGSGLKVQPLSNGPTVPAASFNRPALAGVCVFCVNANHSTSDCRKFSGQSNAEKARLVREHRLCTSCLGRTTPSHKALNCATKTGCQICGERHNTQLHGIPYKDMRFSDTAQGRGGQKSF